MRLSYLFVIVLCIFHFNSSFACDVGFDDINGTCLSKPKCDGISDDTKILQERIDRSVGRKLIIEKTTKECIVEQLNVPSNSHIIVNASMKLKDNSRNPSGSSVATMFYILQAHNVKIEGTGVLDGNRNNQNAPCCGGGIESYYSSEIYVSGLTIKNFTNWPVNLVVTKGASIKNMRLMDSGNSVEFAAGTHDCLAENLEISGINDMGFSFYGGVYNCKINNLLTYNNTSDGISILSDADQKDLCHDIEVSNVVARDNLSNGISIAANTGGNGPHYNISINNFTSYNNNWMDLFNPSGKNVTATNFYTKKPIVYHGEIKFINTEDEQEGEALGVIDGVFFEGENPYIQGWACASQSSKSINVDLYLNGLAGSKNAVAINRYLANLTSESAIANICKSKGSNFRFRIPISNEIASKYSQSSIYLYSIPNQGGAPSLLTNSGKFKVPAKNHPETEKVIGVIDGIFGNSNPSLTGWACTIGNDKSIFVDLYVNGNAGSNGAVGIARFEANKTSENAVAQACGAKGSAYRFSINLDPGILKYSGSKVYMYGISKTSHETKLLENSGIFIIP